MGDIIRNIRVLRQGIWWSSHLVALFFPLIKAMVSLTMMGKRPIEGCPSLKHLLFGMGKKASQGKDFGKIFYGLLCVTFKLKEQQYQL